MKAIVFTGPDAVELQELEEPTLRPGHALCRVHMLGLCGVDLSLLHGYSTYIQKGLKQYPFTPGHEWSGVVLDVAPDVNPALVGRKVAGHNFAVCGVCSACRANRQEQCEDRSEIGVLGDLPGVGSEVVQVPANVLAPLPDDMSFVTGCLLEPASTALHAIASVESTPTDRMLVLGGGTLGLCVALLAKAFGIEPTVVDVAPANLTLARAVGARAVTPDEVVEDQWDVIIEASGAAPAIQLMPKWIAPGGRVALVGVPNTAVDGLSIADLVIKNVALTGVLSGIHVWDQLIALVSSKHVNLAMLVDTVFPLREYKAAYRALGDRNKARPKILIDMTDATTTSGSK